MTPGVGTYDHEKKMSRTASKNTGFGKADRDVVYKALAKNSNVGPGEYNAMQRSNSLKPK